MGELKYSIIIPVYNLADYIERTLDSILDNELQEAEIILINDGSTDNSLEIIKKYVDNHEISRCQILTQTNRGVSSARNVGITAAKGEYLIFMDGDDFCDISMLETLSHKSEGDFDMIVWRFNCVDGNRKTVSQDSFTKESFSGNEFLESLLRGTARIRIGSFAVKRAVVMDNGLRFTEGCVCCEDVEFMYKAVISCKTVKAMNNVLYDYIRREGSAINKYDMRKFQAPLAIRRIYDFAIENHKGEIDDYITDSLKNGLLITHTMFSFDSCCKYIKGIKQYKDFIYSYKHDYFEVEKAVVKAFKEMENEPKVFSAKRLMIFKFSRNIYGLYKMICHKMGRD